MRFNWIFILAGILMQSCVTLITPSQSTLHLKVEEQCSDSTRFITINDSTKAFNFYEVQYQYKLKKAPLHITLSNRDTSIQYVIKPEINPIIYLNILNGGLGLMSDLKQEKSYRYPSALYLDFPNSDFVSSALLSKVKRGFIIKTNSLHYLFPLSANLDFEHAISNSKSLSLQIGCFTNAIEDNYYYNDFLFQPFIGLDFRQYRNASALNSWFYGIGIQVSKRQTNRSIGGSQEYQKNWNTDWYPYFTIGKQTILSRIVIDASLNAGISISETPISSLEIFLYQKSLGIPFQNNMNILLQPKVQVGWLF